VALRKHKAPRGHGMMLYALPASEGMDILVMGDGSLHLATPDAAEPQALPVPGKGRSAVALSSDHKHLAIVRGGRAYLWAVTRLAASE